MCKVTQFFNSKKVGVMLSMMCFSCCIIYGVLHNEAKITDRESPISTISARWGKSADAGYFPAKAKQMGDGIFLP